MLKQENKWFASLNASVTIGAVSWVLPSSGATNLGIPSLIHCESEIVKVTAVAVDTPSSGLDTLTVERAQDGTTATTHAANAYVGQFAYSGYHTEQNKRIDTCLYLLNSMFGGATGISRPPLDALHATAEGTPSMTVDIAPGGGVILGQPFATRVAAALTFTAPGSNPRIDIIEVNQEGVVSAVTGTEAGSPSAPTATAGAVEIAKIHHTTAETSIKDADDATNGYIEITVGAIWL